MEANEDEATMHLIGKGIGSVLVLILLAVLLGSLAALTVGSYVICLRFMLGF